MAYNELIKNFNKIRTYMKDFYVYGFKNRDEYKIKSLRSYDNERRRLESWLGSYMGFKQNSEGKNIFISIDSRFCNNNPLYKAWKAKSFTDGDITLHFIIFDILSSENISLSITELTEKIDEYLSFFKNPKMFDESTIRKKLNEYKNEGLIITEKKGKILYYRRNSNTTINNKALLNYYSEIFPLGVIGSYILDKIEDNKNIFSFKHHYITGAMDNEILYLLFIGMKEKRVLTIETTGKRKNKSTVSRVVPLKIMISVQNGRQYVMAYNMYLHNINPYRTDNIISVKIEEPINNYDELQNKLNSMLPHIWGVSTRRSYNKKLEHVEFTIRYNDNEQYIKNRLEREKRSGTVEHIDKNTSKFSIDVFDAMELMPWIKTFICRIIDINISNKNLEKKFKDDLAKMYSLYDIGGNE